MSEATDYAEQEIADWIGGNGAPGAVTAPAPYIKLHLGAPGEDATANPAVETTRQSASFGVASGGVITSDADIDWLAVSTTETYSHYSGWDAAAAGNALFVGTLTAPVAVTALDNFKIASGDLTVTVD